MKEYLLALESSTKVFNSCFFSSILLSQKTFQLSIFRDSMTKSERMREKILRVITTPHERVEKMMHFRLPSRNFIQVEDVSDDVRNERRTEEDELNGRGRCHERITYKSRWNEKKTWISKS